MANHDSVNSPHIERSIYKSAVVKTGIFQTLPCENVRSVQPPIQVSLAHQNAFSIPWRVHHKKLAATRALVSFKLIV